MKSIIPILFLLGALATCGGCDVEKLLQSRNFKDAHELSLRRLQRKPHDVKYQNALLMSLDSLRASDEKRIKTLQSISMADAKEKIYLLLFAMHERELAVQQLPLIPKKYKAKDYSDRIDLARLDAKKSFIDAADELMGKEDKQSKQKAHALYERARLLDPFDAVLKEKIQTAALLGTVHVLVAVNELAFEGAPLNILNELHNINISNLSRQFLTFHHSYNPEINYDYNVVLELENFNISRPKTTTETINEKKTIVIKEEFVTDTKGNKLKNAQGDFIKKEITEDISAQIKVTNMEKIATVNVAAKVIDNLTGNVMRTYNLNGNNTFKYSYGSFKGDERAIPESLTSTLKNKARNYPSNQQMLQAASRDIGRALTLRMRLHLKMFE